jgi:Tol biopolymer transport system component
MSPKWAPNGNFFLLKRRTSVQDTSAVDEAPLYWWLYDQKGNPILDMGRYGRASGFEDWSPDSRKIALDPAFGRPGFYIVYLRGDGRSVEIERARYVAAPDGQALGTPKWSPDGTKLAFTASFYGDQTGERKELRILADGSYRRYSAGRGSAYSLDPWEWGSPTVLYARGAGTPAAQPGEKRPFIDLDDDGTTDFSFQRPNSGHAEWFEDGQRISKSLVANLVIPEDKNRILKVKDGYLAALEKGEIVGKRVPDSLKWASQASTLYDALTYTSPESTSVVWRGPWPGKKIRYLGLKLVRRGSSYYGWARVRVDTSEAREGPATVHDYAYNPHQGQPIRAGCKP